MSFQFDATALESFLRASPSATWEGCIPRDWAASFVPPSSSVSLPTAPQGRAALRSYCTAQTTTAEECFLAVMAWGRMRIPNAKRAWASKSGWLQLIDELRSSDRHRSVDYSLFSQLRPNRMPGIGPAYFTKLMYFLRSKRDAYILDQWTAKSKHLLTNARAPVMRGHQVADENTAIDYEAYCAIVENLSGIAGWPPDEVEERLFSCGGRDAGAWRRYVKSNWSP